MNEETRNRVLLGALILLNVALVAFAIQLSAGAVPIPEGWAWAVPILTAVVTAATTLLPRVGSENLAADVDALRSAGVSRRDMAVVSRAALDDRPFILHDVPTCGKPGLLALVPPRHDDELLDIDRVRHLDGRRFRLGAAVFCDACGGEVDYVVGRAGAWVAKESAPVGSREL